MDNMIKINLGLEKKETCSVKMGLIAFAKSIGQCQPAESEWAENDLKFSFIKIFCMSKALYSSWICKLFDNADEIL